MSRKTRSVQQHAEARVRWTIPRGRFRPATINARVAGEIVRDRVAHVA